MTKELTHTDSAGKANMVDVSHKPMQKRIAKAKGFIRLQPETVALVRENALQKGDALTYAEIAGIQAAKQTASVIPLCHPLQLSKVSVKATLEPHGVGVQSEITCLGQTGVEIEAIHAVQIALLTVYDMCKAVDKKMVIDEVSLLKKEKLDLP